VTFVTVALRLGAPLWGHSDGIAQECEMSLYNASHDEGLRGFNRAMAPAAARRQFHLATWVLLSFWLALGVLLTIH
jgi:hypothetical protein